MSHHLQLRRRETFSKDADPGEAHNMSVNKNIKHILKRLAKLDMPETFLTKTLQKYEMVEAQLMI